MQCGTICTNTKSPTTLCRTKVIVRLVAGHAPAGLQTARTSARGDGQVSTKSNAAFTHSCQRKWTFRFDACKFRLAGLLPAPLPRAMSVRQVRYGLSF